MQQYEATQAQIHATNPCYTAINHPYSTHIMRIIAEFDQLFSERMGALSIVGNFRRRIQITVEKISQTNVSTEAIQKAGEGLSEFLGRVLGSKMLVNRALPS